MRAGHVTSSEFKTAMSRKGKALSQTARTYLYGLAAEHLTREPVVGGTAAPLEWGHDNELDALQAYCMERNATVRSQPFWRHPAELLIGASPDGFVDDGIIEIKCPYTTKEHVRNVIEQAPKPEYYAQIQGVLWVTDRPWCDFISYDPRCTMEHQLLVLRVPRDDGYIAKQRDLVLEFRDELLAVLEQLNVEPFVFVEEGL